MNEDLLFQSRRSQVIGMGGMVAASQPLAVSAGLDILRIGGNAADAAVAIAAVLNVTEPTSTGIGGDCFALYFDSRTNEISALNGSGRAPADLTLEKLQKEGLGEELPPYHPYTITVPGACAGWFDLIERFGSLPIEKILSPAILLAEKGFPVAPLTSYFWERGVQKQLSTALNGKEMTIDGRAPKAGEIFKNPGLARTFRLISEKGKSAFYHGEIGEALVETIQMAGGCMRMSDLNKHTSTWEIPISTNYGGLRLWECPPNGQGLAALLAINIIENFNIENLSPLSALRLHLEIEAMRLAFADTSWYLADPEFSRIPVNELLSKSYAHDRSKLINRKRASLDQQRGVPIASTDTVYFCVVDKFGNACSFINSNYAGFGTGIVPSGWGFTLQNRGHNFSLQPGHPNVLAPRKRPYHTIIPAMVTREIDQSLYAAMGVMGGFMQPQGHLQVFLSLAVDQLDPQTCLDLPRFCIQDGKAGGNVYLENEFPRRVVPKLKSLGHHIQEVDGYDRALFGRGQIIMRDPVTEVLMAGSDSRADGCAMTLV